METPESTTPSDAWVSLKEAEQVTGVRVKTMRVWYSKGDIQSRLVDGRRGPERRVLLGEVEARRRPEAASRSERSESDALPQPVLQAFAEMAAQLADRSAAAARAETEASFLRGQVSDLRAELDATREASTSQLVNGSAKRWWHRSG